MKKWLKPNESMSRSFKLIDEYFSSKDNELQWTYEVKFTFNYQSISEITITDHWTKKPGREMITNELICEIIEKKLKRVNPMPDSYLLWGKDIFSWCTTYQGRTYRLFFWFKDNTTNHLWIKNIHPVD